MKKTALVLGGSGGIGSAIVQSLRTDYETVVVGYHDTKPKSNTETAVIDLTKPNASRKAVQKLLQEGFIFDTVIHAASPSITYQKFTTVPLTIFEQQYAVAVISFVAILQEIVPFMQKNNGGRIIAISSALAHNVPTSQLSFYISAKQALMGLCKALAVEFAPYHITVNTISPGVTDTAFLNTFPPQMKQLARAKIPLKELLEPRDIANCVKFLCSEQARMITGIDIPVAGGMVM